LGLLQTLIWLDQSQEWFMYKSDPADACGVYETCGPFGVCSVESNPICSCLPGFVPRFPRDWDLSDCSSGCVRQTPLQCDDNRYEFLRLTNVLPADSRSLAVDNTEICEFACSINCSCNAYSVSSNGGGCLLWNGDLLDLQNRTNGRDFFLKLDRLQDHNNGQPRNRTVLRIAIPLSVFIVVVSLACALGFLRLHRRKIKQIGEYIFIAYLVTNMILAFWV
jgi:hypothetical protein